MKRSTSLWWFLFIVLFVISNNSFAQDKQKRVKGERPGKTITVDDLRRELGEDWEKIVISKIRSEEPQAVVQLLKKKKKDSARYYSDLAKLWRHYKKLDRLKDENPERYKTEMRQHQLDQKSKRLTNEYRKSKSEARKLEIRAELKTCLFELFELREQQRENKVKELQQEIENLKSMLEYRKNKKEEIVKSRMDELLKKDERIKW